MEFSGKNAVGNCCSLKMKGAGKSKPLKRKTTKRYALKLSNKLIDFKIAGRIGVNASDLAKIGVNL